MDRIGRYKIVRELGRGAMGVVYHAIDPNIGRPVAIKTIQFGGTRKPEELDRMRERLFREARSAGMLSHPGIVTIYDVEQQGDLAYIAMEYVDGPTLESVLGEPQPIDPGRMFSILAQTATALDYAHSKGIVHRDIKPANIMLAADGTSKITDFGIAKITAAEQFTMTGSIVGTPHYMSPEQVQGHQVDGRSDQFSLAVIAYEMLTGEKPYTGEHLTTVVYKIVAEEPAAPHRLNPSLAGPIEGVLRKALAKKPDARYRTCQEFTEALEKAAIATKGWKLLARGGTLNAPTVADVGARTGATLPPPRRPRRGETTATAPVADRRKSGFLPFLLAILAAAGLLVLIGWQAAPWLMPGSKPASNETHGAPAKEEPPAPGPKAEAAPPVTPGLTPPVQTPATEPAPEDAKPGPVRPAPAPEDAKPSPVGPPPEAVRQPPAAPSRPMRNTAMQDVVAISSPAGATASLDGNGAVTCLTPCSLSAAPGRHTLTFSMPGYQLERRDIVVASSTLELAPVTLRAAGGTLMLTSDPLGAAISIDGKRMDMVTPAPIPLASGVHTVTLEKDGRQATEQVDIRNGINYLKLQMHQ